MDISTPRCPECKLYTCIHKTQNKTRVITIGETVGAPIENANSSVSPINANSIIETKSVPLITKEPEEVKYRISSDGNFIVCKECMRLVSNHNYCTYCGHALLNPSVEERNARASNLTVISANIESQTSSRPETITTSASQTPSKDDGVLTTCNYCEQPVFIDFLDAHLKTHILEAASATAVPLLPSKGNVSANIPTTEPEKKSPQIDLTKFAPPKPNANLKSIDKFKFREIEAVSAETFISKDRRFSDLNIIIWLKERFSIASQHYVNAGWQSSSEYDRIVVGITFDAVDEYYSISVKKLTHSSTYSWTNYEDSTPEKLCFNQSEILQEVKKALLFLRVPPRSVYKRFLKAVRKNPLTIDYNKENMVVATSTYNQKDLVAALKNLPETKHSSDDHGCGGWAGMYS